MSIRITSKNKSKLVQKSNDMGLAAAARFAVELLESRILLSVTNWKNPAGGDFDNPANWDNGVPTTGMDAVVNIAVSAPITKSANSTDTFASLTSSDPITLTGGTLDITGAVTETTSAFTLAGGTLKDATLSTPSGGQFVANGGTLDGATVSADFQINNANSVAITDGLTLNGTLSLGNSTRTGWLNFIGSETLGGTGTVVMGPVPTDPSVGTYNGLFESAGNGVLTIGSGITVRGQQGIIGFNSGTSQGTSTASVNNLGTIKSDVSGGFITLQGAGDQNNGTIDALNGGTFVVFGQLTNAATMFIDGTSDIGSFGASLATISGGTITTQASASITGLTLSGVTVSGDWQMSNANSVAITNGLTLNGTLSLGNSTRTGWLNFIGTQTLGGTGTVVMGPVPTDPSVGTYNGLFESAANGVLTIGSGVTVRGQQGIIGFNSGTSQGTSTASVNNLGTIKSDVSGGFITLQGASDQNNGTIDAINGGTFVVFGQLTNAATIFIDGVSDIGSFGASLATISGGTITEAGGSITGLTLSGVTVSGDWQLNNANSVAITSGLTLNGTLSLGNSTTMGWLNFDGNETLGGTGTVVFGAANNIHLANTYSGLFETAAGGTLTIGSGITVHGDWGVIGYDDGGQGSASGSVINQGTIAADVSHDVIFLQSSNSQNLGTIEALNAAEFRINGQLTNSGTAFVDSVSALDGNGPSAGALVGGTVTTQAGAQIANLTLNGITVSGDWQMINNNSALITNGLTLSGTLSLGNNTTMGWLNFNGSETLGGTGTVVFGAAKNTPLANTYSGLFETANGTLTIGSGITVHGDWGVIGYDDGGQGSASGSVINQGTIAADVSHDVIFLQSSNSQNLGTIEALNAAEFRINGQLTNSGTAFVDSVSALDGNGPTAGGSGWRHGDHTGWSPDRQFAAERRDGLRRLADD